MTPFTEVHPCLESYWRAVILFGRNVASYKFALAKSLIELAGRPDDLVPPEDLATPFSRHLCEHLKGSDRQGTFARSRFLDACRKFNAGEVDQQRLVDETAKLGFVNVIDAFHVVHDGEVGVRFFADERKGPRKGIRLAAGGDRLGARPAPARPGRRLRRRGRDAGGRRPQVRA
jgi:hypothetical protein